MSYAIMSNSKKTWVDFSKAMINHPYVDNFYTAHTNGQFADDGFYCFPNISKNQSPAASGPVAVYSDSIGKPAGANGLGRPK